MQWHEITIHTTEEATEAISHYMHELGAGGVSIEESGSLNRPRDTSLGQWYELPLNDIPEGEAVMKGYFSDLEDIDSIVKQISKFVGSLMEFGLDAGKAEISVREVDEEDWATAWKQYYKPVKISERITVKPTWEPYESAADELVIELDPGMAFGTGTHATTSLCLRTLEKVIKPGDHVIDVGTGSGILAIGAAKLGAERVLAIDLDPVAVSSSEENVKLNGLEGRITVRESDLLQVFHDHREKSLDLGVKLPVKVVVANILAEIILLFIDDVYQVLEQEGTYVVSGVITSKEDAVAEALEKAGFRVEYREREDDWVVLTARKV
ncbi:50S ribosomal protein L11 methyltransferase [Marinicrinis lubricantis]|uniref:Ribosomal protein L11 methyltransferase n=1 Tax=Marinicrinis lubricantis TaxID=2086470 RepID=A0ABW1IUR6_9BACL